jgi:hypothetical protein
VVPFERFDKRSVPIAENPFVTIQMRGPISLNYSAYETLGGPEAVEMLYDREKQIVGLRSISPKEAYAFPVRPQGRKGKRPSNFVVAGQAFTKHYGIDTSVARRFPAEMQDDILTVDLKRGTVATGPRLKDKDGANA